MIQITKGNPYQIGVTVLSDTSINIAVEMACHDCGMILYHKKSGEQFKLPFESKYQIGDLYCIHISGLVFADYDYNFYEGEEEIVDPDAKMICGNQEYGRTAHQLRASFYQSDFDWGEDVPLQIPYCNSLFYLVHPRGFTKDLSSCVQNPGTFEGLIEKIDYLKELHITAVLLTPSYEFLEMEEKKIVEERVPYAYQKKEPVLNYWGYKNGFYFAVKSGYCKDGADASHSFKNMVKKFHENGMEVLMQFYFGNGEVHSKILDILHYWVLEYHVDGFQLMGEIHSLSMIGADPLLRKTKLIYYGFPVEDIYKFHSPSYRNLAECNDRYCYDLRRFLKSDERSLQRVINHMKYLPKKLGCIHYITEINGFTLADLFSYDRKHNEANGENNRDGNPYNASWNCGEEGPTRKKSILNLRVKQMKNAFALSLLSESTPLLLMGDEFANTQNGNNNAYCQDNEISWLNWNQQEAYKDLFNFVKRMIAFRFQYPILHRDTECTMLDMNETGYPDLSFHGDEAFKCPQDDLLRHFAMLYHEDSYFIFIAINMHWVNHDFALPKLPRGVKWVRVFDTACIEEKQGKAVKNSKKLSVTERSIQVLVAEIS